MSVSLSLALNSSGVCAGELSGITTTPGAPPPVSFNLAPTAGDCICVNFLSAGVFAVWESDLFCVIRVGNVGSRDKWCSWTRVVKKRVLRAVLLSDFFRALEHAVQLEFIKPQSLHESAGGASGKYGHIISALQ